MLAVKDIRICAAVEPIAVLPEEADVSWQISDEDAGVLQKNYKIELFRGEKCVYKTPRVASKAQRARLPRESLSPGTLYRLRVSVTDSRGKKAEATTTFAVAYDDLPQRWIRPRTHIKGGAVYFKRVFSVKEGLVRAVLCGAPLGCGDFMLDGDNICDHYFDSAVTNFDKTILYRAYDVKAHLSVGEHALSAYVGDGFWAQTRVWKKGTRHGTKLPPYADTPALWAALVLTYESGEVQTVSTAESGWLTAPGPTLVNNIYLGEVYDSRREVPDVGALTSSVLWDEAVVDKRPKGALRPTLMPACRLLEILPAKSVSAPVGKEWEGAYIYDFGANIAGNVRLRLPPCPAGTQITVRYGETLTKEGYVDYRSTGAYAVMALQQDTYIAKGGTEWETWEPVFSYKGFRYAEISGLFTRAPSPRMAVGLAIATDLPERSSFTCGHEQMKRLFEITRRTFRSNFHSYPEDCPAREKSGWLGDAQWCTPLWLYHFESDLALEKYVDDLTDSFDLYGELPMVSPGRRTCGRATPLWGEAIVQIPYRLWKMRGRDNKLRSAYPYMRSWLDSEHSRFVGGLPVEGLGDWLPPVGNESPLRAPVEQACAFGLYEGAVMLTEMAQHLGYTDDVAYYDDFAKKLKARINRVYYKSATGSYGYDVSDAASLVLGVAPNPTRTFRALCARLEESGAVMTGGAWGNMFLLEALAEYGRMDLALAVMFGKEHANFASMMAQGATSLSERMEQPLVGAPAGMQVGSFNHPMHGACMKFLYDTVAGIRPLEAGFTRFVFAPAGYAELGGLSVSVNTPQGDIHATVSDMGVAELTVPCGAVCVCGSYELRPGKYRITL